MIVTLPWPPSVNRMWRQFKGRTLLSKEGRDYRIQALGCCLSVIREHGPFLGPVEVSIAAYCPDARRRDVDNLFKAPLDVLTHAGLWQDDSQIDKLTIQRAGIDRAHPRLDVKVVEYSTCRHMFGADGLGSSCYLCGEPNPNVDADPGP